jgi:hypothetical protein
LRETPPKASSPNALVAPEAAEVRLSRFSAFGDVKLSSGGGLLIAPIRRVTPGTSEQARAMTQPVDAELPPEHPWPRSRLLNVWVDDLTMEQLMQRLESGIVFTLNLDHCYHLQRNAEFYAAYRKADFVTSDSKYVYWSLGWIGRRIQEKVSGSDIVPAFCRHHAANPDTRIFLLGAGPGIAQRARERINARTGREIVVSEHGPSMQFGNEPRQLVAAIFLKRRVVRAQICFDLFLGVAWPEIARVTASWMPAARARS